ncbi:hypothetical protein NIES4073_39480 [Kalymmatonema gypsitolerans NIES-4073]|nr:hypothetical protein SAMD00079811_67810 [Scytonema sp. HK-05]BAZ23060.1 hypothetical protein NIES4073_39480 [Scytonema sp. NIES-4073]
MTGMFWFLGFCFFWLIGLTLLVEIWLDEQEQQF